MYDPNQETLFIVWWTDYVANDWIETVVGPYEDTDNRLYDLLTKGQKDFGMTRIAVSQNDVDRLGLKATKTVDEFFALDWAEWLGPVTV